MSDHEARILVVDDVPENVRPLDVGPPVARPVVAGLRQLPAPSDRRGQTGSRASRSDATRSKI